MLKDQRLQSSRDSSSPSTEAALLPTALGRVLGWRGITLEQQIALPTEHSLPPLSEHAVVIALDQPVHMFQRREGRNRELLIGAGDIIIVPAGMPSLCRWSAPFARLRLGLQDSFLKQVAADIELPAPEHVELENIFSARDAQLESLVLALRDEMVSSHVGGRLYAESLATALSIHLLRHHAQQQLPPLAISGLPRATLQRAVEYINDHLAHEVTLGEIAQAVGLSPYHFARGFKQAMGLAPHQYLTQRRVEQAQRLLLDTTLSIAEVAVRVGFYDRSHLARHMRRVLGVTPQVLIQSRKNIR